MPTEEEYMRIHTELTKLDAPDIEQKRLELDRDILRLKQEIHDLQHPKLVRPSGIVLTARDESIWQQATQAQHAQTHKDDLAKFCKVVEDVKADNYYQHYQVAQEACDAILKALEGEA